MSLTSSRRAQYPCASGQAVAARTLPPDQDDEGERDLEQHPPLKLPSSGALSFRTAPARAQEQSQRIRRCRRIASYTRYTYTVTEMVNALASLLSVNHPRSLALKQIDVIRGPRPITPSR